MVPLIRKETAMTYKTMVLELLEQRPEMYDRLRKERLLLPALDFYARELKASHEARKVLLSQAKPASSENQIASEALEIALKELEDSLPPAFPPDNNEALSLDDAMAFIRRHSPPA
jgi:hypothetical protein